MILILIFFKFSHPQLFLNDDKLVVAANIARGTVVRSEISKIFLPILLILAKKFFNDPYEKLVKSQVILILRVILNFKNRSNKECK